MNRARQFLALVLVLSVRLLYAQAPATGAQKLYLGAAWYPEALPEARWDTDLTLMLNAGINYVRLTEFAWSGME